MGADPVDFEVWHLANHARLVASLLLVTGELDLTRDAVDEACARGVALGSRRTDGVADGLTFRVGIGGTAAFQRQVVDGLDIAVHTAAYG